MAKVVVIAGMSGAGRSTAAAALEDVGWFVIDNLPAALISTIGNLAISAGDDYEKVALVIGGYSDEMSEQLELLEEAIEDYRLLYLEASNDALLTRFKATKRRHPLAAEMPLADAIASERSALQSAKIKADLVIDTSQYNPYDLRQRISDEVAEVENSGQTMQLRVLSFGFKHGIPRDVDLIFDCRFMPNPHWVPELKAHTGKEKIVQDYVMEPRVSQDFLDQLEQMMATLLPAYAKEGKSYMTIAVGCTGGKHRSVAVGELLSSSLTENGWDNIVSHRDVEKK